MSVHADTRMILAGRPLDVGDQQEPLAVLVSGFLRIARQRADGRRQIAALICPGDLIEVSQMTDFMEIEAATDATICTIPRSRAAGILTSSHPFRRALLAARQRMADRMREHVWALGALHPAGRMALFLVNSSSIMPWQALPSGGGILTMELGRADIADYLGTTAETVCRVVGRLDEMGLIRARDHRHFEIPDLRRLGRFAGIGSPMAIDPDVPLFGRVADDVGQCKSAGLVVQ
ncbi:Crp/Fnr family transcriptional regulator [Jannaschia formosa]|uniref:Crp/Fnr family transcriptional regulator n=1 Tax=Jannaschia formosa TaxID=2259592 RepID=UPI0014304B0A|nr:Crp/Fnr family transcriptional regulator [Jannaschia formosa]